MNDLDVILGYATDTAGPEITSSGRVCYWPGPAQAPSFISVPAPGGSRYAFDAADYFWKPRGPGPILSDDGHFFAHSSLSSSGEIGLKRWKLSEGTSYEDSTSGLGYLRGPSLAWGPTYADGKEMGLVHAPGNVPLLPSVPLNVIPMPGGIHIATRNNPWTGPDARALKDGQWIETPSYAHAIDIADNGVAIGRQHDDIRAPIWVNGKWTAITRTAPHATAWYEEGFRLFHDMSPNGWILGERLIQGGSDHFVMLPIRAAGTYTDSEDEWRDHSAGVDDVSIGSSTPDFRDDEELPPPVQDRIWIMAPQNGRSATVIFKSPLNEETPLKISAPGIKFNGSDDITLNAPVTTVEVNAVGAASGADVPAVIQFGATGSLSQPLGFKVMKERTIKVTVHPVRSIVPGKAPNAPNVIPDEALLEGRLNDIYRPQINARFVVTVKDMVDLEWDNAIDEDMGGPPPENGDPDKRLIKPGNGVLDWRGGNDLRKEEQTIHGALGDPGENINIYVLGGGAIHGLILWDGRLIRPQGIGAYAFAKRERRVIFVDGDADVWDSILMRNFAEDQYLIHAHEIGHVLVGDGHPDQKAGAAPLPGLSQAAYQDRLMVSGEKVRRTDRGILLVKGEWDGAERWMKQEEDDGRILP